MPPSLVGGYHFHPPDARAIFLHNDFYVMARAVTRGFITFWGGGAQTEKIRIFLPICFTILFSESTISVR